jgi:hypothetical protein
MISTLCGTKLYGFKYFRKFCCFSTEFLRRSDYALLRLVRQSFSGRICSLHNQTIAIFLSLKVDILRIFIQLQQQLQA